MFYQVAKYASQTCRTAQVIASDLQRMRECTGYNCCGGAKQEITVVLAQIGNKGRCQNVRLMESDTETEISQRTLS